MTAIKTLGTKLLGLLISDVSAGACVPENGYECYCRSPDVGKHAVWFRYNCYGTCVQTADPCTVY